MTTARDASALARLIPGLEKAPVVGILRGCPRNHARAVVAAAVSKGLAVVEVTLDSPEALAQIADLAGDGSATVGAGSVTTPTGVEQAVEAGAGFVVTPVTLPEVVEACRRLEVPCLLGAATPTEVLTAWRLGAAAVKVFPAAQLGGPGYLTALASPLGEPPLVPTGGVTAADAGGYLQAGAVAVGAGSDLFPSAALATGDTDAVAARAREWIEATT